MQAQQLDLFDELPQPTGKPKKKRKPKVKPEDEPLPKKIERALWLLRTAAADSDQPIEISYSGGKDSDVILELARMAGIPYRAIYKNTTIDPPGTIKHCHDNGVEVVRRKSFAEVIQAKGFPNFTRRFCCRELKEYKILDRSVQGIRRSESTKRRKRYKEPTVCRLYGKKQHVEVFLPILYWSDKDVADFIEQRGIKCHPLYYDEQGRFCAKRRLGCMGCPRDRQPESPHDRLRRLKVTREMLTSLVQQYRPQRSLWNIIDNLSADIKAAQAEADRLDAETLEQMRQSPAYKDFEQAVKDNQDNF